MKDFVQELKLNFILIRVVLYCMRSGVVRMAGCRPESCMVLGAILVPMGAGLSGKLLFLPCGIVHEADPPAAHDPFCGHRRDGFC